MELLCFYICSGLPYIDASQVKIDTYRIEELGKFAKIIPPAGSCHSEAHRAGRIIHRLASEAVTFRPTAHKILKQ